ncbi:LYR family protein [Penicillium maclennaniae]|uniref:LYR family protein n=1 Tax=Penicillium maclennaniae TaxID=1343394 RepID=UPI002540DDEE|nr:LYR family protein [Penicillium maclennaniae]KAJ5668051.1 LYR family protein [Penicillium maclennaniae]
MSVASLHRDTAFQARSLFANYNFREYALRKTRDSFREHQNESEERRIQELIQAGLQDLRLLKRQTVISQFYQLDKLVVEGQKSGKETGDRGNIVRQKDTGLVSLGGKDHRVAHHAIDCTSHLAPAIRAPYPSLDPLPRFRSSRSGRHLDGPNRTRTGQIDHDVFEGLPVRRWSKQPHTYSQAPKAVDDSDFGVQGPGGPVLPELPMPRDSDLLPAVSKALLRAARAGCIYIRQNTTAAEKQENDQNKTDDQNTGAVQMDRSFTSRKWLTLPKHMEPPEVEFLAKRRPGLLSLYGGASVDGSSGSLPMRRTKFKKIDPETGNISIYEAWVPKGHRIEGEVTGDVQTLAEQSSVPVKPETPAPGTVVEGVGIVNSEGVVVAEAGSAAVMEPPKRRPPPPKRKGKGIGKGRKKKVMFAPGEGADASTVHSVASGAEGGTPASGEGQDSQMSVDQSGQDDDDEDGEDGDESDEGDESMLDAKSPETPGGQSVTESTPQPSADTPAESQDVDMTEAAPEAPHRQLLQKPPRTDADAPTSASETPGLPTQESEKPTAEQSVSATTESTGDVAPKEEIEAPGQVSVPATDSAAEPLASVTPAQQASQPATSEVKVEAQNEGPDETTLAPPSVDPENPVNETLEPTKEEGPLHATKASEETMETKPTDNESAQPEVQAQETSSASAPVAAEGLGAGPEADSVVSEAQRDVEMDDAPHSEPVTAHDPDLTSEPQSTATDPIKSAPEPVLGTEDAAPTETEPETTAPPVEQEASPVPEPTQAESAPEENQDEPEAPLAEPA